MIQRPQTLFLFGIIICLTLFLIFPLWLKDIDSVHYELNAFSFTQTNSLGTQAIKNVQYLAFIALVSIGLTGYIIYSFKKRMLQIKLCMFNSLLNAGLVAVTMYFIYKVDAQAGLKAGGDFYIGFFMPVLALLCNRFAMFFIKKDEILVKSADRLR